MSVSPTKTVNIVIAARAVTLLEKQSNFEDLHAANIVSSFPVRHYEWLRVLNTINPKNVQELVNELHDDYAKTVNTFSANHSQSLLQFTELVSNCYKKYELFNSEENLSQRAIDVGGYVFLAIDNVYVSVKLLVLGYIAPSGNSMRQSLESVCTAILLSHNGQIDIGKVKTPRKVDFFELYSAGDKKSLSYQSLRYVDANKEALGVRAEAIAAFFVGKDHYNECSHPNKYTLASRMVGADGGSFVIGGEYDEDKKSAYEKELRDRIRYVSIIPTFVDVVYERAKNV